MGEKMTKQFIYYLKQHVGVPSEPIVKQGDLVKRGQKIAACPSGKLGVPIHASINGLVTKVTENDIRIQMTETRFSDYQKLFATDAIQLIEESGLVGLGGAGFPTYEKLKSSLSENGVCIVNAAECEPVLGHNIARIEKEPENLIEGMRQVLKILGIQKGVIAIKAAHVEAVRKIQEADKEKICKIAILEDQYPAGEERAVIREVLKILLKTDELPKAADAVVLNAETVFRIKEAILDRKPLIDKDITVAGKLKENAACKVLENVPIGMQVKDVFEMAGGIGPEYGEIIMGGPFTGKRTELENAIEKTTGALIATETFLKGPEKIGLLVCACGAGETRLKEIAKSMGSEVAGVEYCKQAVQNARSIKCENPGRCPGQAGKVISLKKQGAQALLISNCTDCSNTVMACAPKMGLPVHHCTDAALRAVNHKLIRRNQSGEV